MTRLGGFPEHRPSDLDALFESTTPTSGAEVIRSSIPPGPKREALLNELLGALQEQSGDMTAMIDELRALMAGRNLTQLINSVVVPAMTVIYSSQSVADGDTTSTWAAKIEYLVGVALSIDPAGEEGTPTEVTRRVTQLISDIFEADEVRMASKAIEDAADGEEERGFLLHQMRLDYQADRMPGYAAHLEHVDAEVFGRHRDYYLNGLGFDPADVIRCTRRVARSANQTFSDGLNTVADALNGGGSKVEAGEAIRTAFDAITLWKPADVAERTGIAVEQVAAMLDFFSTKYGCQPKFRSPSDLNQARTHPCIAIDEGTYLVPDPWALSAVIHHRLAVEPKRDGYDPAKYYKHRQDGHERMVAGALEKIFGAANVRSGRHYDLAAGTHGEIDALVCTEWPLVVEAKAIALTEPGRRGAPRRVDAKIKTILGKALEQTDRALTYILDEGGRSFAPTENGQPVQLLPEELSGGTAIIVTFERIDPFSFSGLAVAGGTRRPTWVVSLTDLLMVVDLLDNPAAFHHYARIRAGMYAAQASSSTEADAVGAYLLSRLSILDSADVNTRILIGYSCEEINDFYTRQEFGLSAKKPSTGVSEDVVGALTDALKEPGWVTFVDVVMVADASIWKKWKKFRRRHQKGGVFTLSEQASLVISSSAKAALERVGDLVSINFPGRS